MDASGRGTPSVELGTTIAPGDRAPGDRAPGDGARGDRASVDRASVDQTLARARATRQALLIAAAEQFYTAGYHAGSLREIVTNAGVTKGALYFHFPHKRALADAVITEMNAIWTELVAEVTAHGLDPLTALLALSDQVVTHLVGDPIVRGGTRLLHDPWLRSGRTAAAAAHQYEYGEAVVAIQLAAAAAAGLLVPGLADPQRAQLAQSVIATITGHHMICDLTGADTELWYRVTAMWQDLLPMIATDPWLEHWRTSNWAHRPHPPMVRPCR